MKPETREAIRKVLDKLPPEQRKLVMAHVKLTLQRKHRTTPFLPYRQSVPELIIPETPMEYGNDSHCPPEGKPTH